MDAVEREYRDLMEGIDSESPSGQYLRWVRKAILPTFATRDEAANNLAFWHRFTIG